MKIWMSFRITLLNWFVINLVHGLPPSRRVRCPIYAIFNVIGVATGIHTSLDHIYYSKVYYCFQDASFWKRLRRYLGTVVPRLLVW